MSVRIKILCISVILLFGINGCGRSASPKGWNCDKELCVKLDVIEPIVWGKPIALSITILSEKDLPDIGITIFPHGNVVDFETSILETGDNVDFNRNGINLRTMVKANQPTTIIQKLLLTPKEGLIELYVHVSENPYYVINTIKIHYNRKGGEVNPPIKRYTGTLEFGGVGRSKIEGGYECYPGPCLTITVDEPVRWGEPVKASLQILGDKDFPQLGISVFSPNTSVRITSEKGDFKDLMTWQAGFWWLTDVIANQPQNFTFTASFPDQEGAYQLQAQAYDLTEGMVSFYAVEIHQNREGGKIYYIDLGTPAPENTYPPSILLYTPTPEPTSTATPQVYPPPEQEPLLAAPSQEAYPAPQDTPQPSLLESIPTAEDTSLPSYTPELSTTLEETSSPSSTPETTQTVTP